MFEKIVVPLDGSVLAEQALTPACMLAQAFESELILTRVAVAEEVAVAAGLGLTYFDLHELMEKHRLEEAETYLRSLETQWRNHGVRVRPVVTLGAPAEMIVATAKQVRAGLIVMSTHGRSGLSRLIYGSVAEAVLRAGVVPVMLIPIKA